MLVSDQQLLRDRIRRAADAAAQKRFRRREAQLARQVAVAGSSRGAETSGVLLCLKRCGKVSSALARVAWTCEALSAPSPREQGDDDAAGGGVFRGAFVRGDRRLAVNQHVHYKPRYASLTATELLLFKTEADVRRGAPYHAVPLLGASCALARDESPSSATNRARSKLGGQSGAPTLVLTSGNSTSKKRRDVLVFASPRPGDDARRPRGLARRVRLLARREQQRRAARDHDAAHHDVDAAEEEAPPRQRSAEDHAPPPDAGAGRGRFEFASTRV
ncbi:adenylate cyclase [Aureococcus anophagefferens]|nr:adenylate cyclase [Aureococcus anophagefferens]